MTVVNSVNAAMIATGAYGGATWTDVGITLIICAIGAFVATWLF
ncbi:hypothetical protein SPFM17_00188 [Salmonella phage SPFM17]|nr:hypothetical protein SPFM4_00176 [Salmonella phage SPFM4]VFR12349.1 hypothetical protein SPFM11_00040 [Salmonella phage SPFM11]VFR12913.1 hypothetical protein SPFM13_00144 [Salmonella phage SPFM13]VFR14100.1 hypothetical protein SPFM17_00188 [Salmonella phage SPFM17]VFR14349.1 hypothetical protein SPFM16_00179 [Salmonella phage SPFM16]VFR14482.1 hypothetical protein SPFM19_00062 [Salmonella phage SPFM19]VFR15047.1 hypothetical protein SPFM22_00073 [Salmonella phage SPFM22]VFR15472.1 hypot